MTSCGKRFSDCAGWAREKFSSTLLRGHSGHIGDDRAIPLIAVFQRDPSDCIRLRVAMALGRFTNEPVAMQLLLTLIKHPDGEVRDWATFGVGILGRDQDSPEIRDATRPWKSPRSRFAL